MTELFNIHDGEFACISASEREAHPGAEYFTAERAPKEYEKLDGIKRVILTFRRIVTEKDGKIVDCVKSGEEFRFAACEHEGRTVLVEGNQISRDDKLLGVLVLMRSVYYDYK